MPKNAKKNVYKEKEFNIYVLWKFLPAHLKGMQKNDLKLSGYEDPLISKIIKIKNQTEFANYFHIKDLGTLTDWNKRIKKDGITSPSLKTNLNDKFGSIEEKISLPNISKLRSKINKQNKIILLLKEDIIVLKKELDKTRRKKQTKKIVVATSNELSSPASVNTPVEIKLNRPTFIQRVKSLFNF